MLRSAAKNHASVTVVVDPADYAVVLDELAASLAKQVTKLVNGWRESSATQQPMML